MCSSASNDIASSSARSQESSSCHLMSKSLDDGGSMPRNKPSSCRGLLRPAGAAAACRVIGTKGHTPRCTSSATSGGSTAAHGTCAGMPWRASHWAASSPST